MEANQILKCNLPSNNKAIKFEYNKIQKPPNFFRGENTNNDKQPKKFSYDKTEKFYTSRVKENEIEPKLLLDKLPQAFHLNNQNSNDSKTSTQTKKSSNEPKSNYNKLSLDYSDVSPDYKNKHDTNLYKQKRRSEERKKINNFFIEEEINIQKKLQMKRNHTQNDKGNNDILPLKIVTKNNNDYLDVKKSSTNNNKNLFIYNFGNKINNNYLKTDLSEYEGLRPKNNLIDLGYAPKNYFFLKNYTFNTSMKDKLKNSEKPIKEKKYSINNEKITTTFNEALNMSDLYKNNYRKSSDSDIYPKKIKHMENGMKKDEHSGSCMNMVNYQHFNQLNINYSPSATKIENNTIANNKFRKEDINNKLRLKNDQNFNYYR